MGPRVYNGSHSNPKSISVLYPNVASTNSVNDWNIAAIELRSLVDANKNNIKILGRKDLKPSIYTVTAQWNRRIDYSQPLALKEGDTVKQYMNGTRILLSAPDKYNITFRAKAGMTYVFEVASTMNFFTNSPDKICITEELHNAIGAVGARLNPDSRYPSKNAKIIACSK